MVIKFVTIERIYVKKPKRSKKSGIQESGLVNNTVLVAINHLWKILITLQNTMCKSVQWLCRIVMSNK